MTAALSATASRHLLPHTTSNGSPGRDGVFVVRGGDGPCGSAPRRVRGLETHVADRRGALKGLPIVADIRGAGFFHAVEPVGDLADGGFSDAARATLVADLIPPRLREAALPARVHDRAAPRLRIAPPPISDRPLPDRITEILADTLDEAAAVLA
ncbi:hypothetical protein [Saccharothrix stipae]